MKDRERVCKYYTYAGGDCLKRGVPVYLAKECQTCKKYDPLAGAAPRRPDTRRKKQEKAIKEKLWEY